MKLCTKCKQPGEFCKDKSAKDGLQRRCKSCNRLYRNTNKDKIKPYMKAYNILNSRKLKNYFRGYRATKKEQIRNRQREYEKTRRKTNPLYKLTKNLRAIAWRAKSGFKLKPRTVRLLGCSFEKAQEHLIQTAISNYGIYDSTIKYHIDHIIPLSSAKTEEEIIKLSHYSNLQYLLPEHNLEKHAKLDWTLPKTQEAPREQQSPVID